MCLASASRDVSLNSFIMSMRRRAPVSLALMRERTSPLTSTGLREFARMIDRSSSLSFPSFLILRCGISVPSSKEELALADMPTPPTSMTWQVEAKKATSFLPKKTGVIIT